jgi:hypothetical protein
VTQFSDLNSREGFHAPILGLQAASVKRISVTSLVGGPSRDMLH